jgi:glutathione S-transferase
VCAYHLVEQQDDGFELFESRAIGRYLATLGSGPELIPIDPKARAKFEQAASIEYAQFDPIAGGIIIERVFKQFRGLPADEQRVKELVSRLESKLDAYEVILGKQKYLAGDVRPFHSKHVQKRYRY